MNTDTLGTKIKKKANEEYELAVRTATNNFRTALAVNVCCTYVKLESAKQYSINELLGKIATAAFKQKEKSLGEKAIEDFLAQVENLQEQIEELQDVR
jgi:hypothetical protein